MRKAAVMTACSTGWAISNTRTRALARPEVSLAAGCIACWISPWRTQGPIAKPVLERTAANLISRAHSAHAFGSFAQHPYKEQSIVLETYSIDEEQPNSFQLTNIQQSHLNVNSVPSFHSSVTHPPSGLYLRCWAIRSLSPQLSVDEVDADSAFPAYSLLSATTRAQCRL